MVLKIAAQVQGAEGTLPDDCARTAVVVPRMVFGELEPEIRHGGLRLPFGVVVGRVYREEDEFSAPGNGSENDWRDRNRARMRRRDVGDPEHGDDGRDQCDRDHAGIRWTERHRAARKRMGASRLITVLTSFWLFRMRALRDDMNYIRAAMRPCARVG